MDVGENSAHANVSSQNPVIAIEQVDVNIDMLAAPIPSSDVPKQKKQQTRKRKKKRNGRKNASNDWNISMFN